MAPRPVIIDCDPGQDDAVNLLLALASPDELDILGITTVAGNVPLDLTQRNARLVCEIAGRNDIKVYAGCAQPVVRDLITAEYVHGRSGIDGIDIREPDLPLESEHAVDFIIRTLLGSAENSITLVPTGPLTNIAIAIDREPAILSRICEIVLMGGAMREGGNTTPSAEFNILVDPQAADMVFKCGRPVVVMGLDVTHQVLATRERVERIRALDNEVAAATCGLLSFFNRYDAAKYGADGAPLHDPCTVAWLLEPDMFSSKLCNIAVETESELTMGHTAVDFWGVSDRPANARWVYSIDADRFFDLLNERLDRFGNGNRQ